MQNISSLINLIEAVKNHPTLFTNSLPNEDQDNFKEWSAVAEECKLTCAQVQDQWNLLLLEYVDYLRSNQDFRLAKHMDFLQPHFFTVVDNDNIDEDELLNALDSKRLEIVNTTKIEHKEEEQSPALVNNIKIERFSKTNKLEEPCFATTTLPKTPPPVQSLPQVVNPVNISQNNSSFSNLSSLELIFLGYAKQLQKMTLPLQLKIKRKIADLMDDAELEMINSQ